MVNLLILLLPVAMVFNVIYAIELSLLLRAMEQQFHGLWRQLGSPRMGRATKTVVIPILRGRFAAAAQLDEPQRVRCDRIRGYLIGLLPYWLIAIPIFLLLDYSALQASAVAP